MARFDGRSSVDDYYRRVAQSLVSQIEEGTACWTQAWKPGEKALPCNVKTGKQYRGGNSVWLASTADNRGYSDERWGTFRQVRELGGQVQRGEKGCAILFWQFETKRLARGPEGKPILDDEGKPVYEIQPLASPRAFTYTVFNAEQCNGLPARPQRPGSYAWGKHEEAEQVFREAGAVIEHSGKNRAYYDLRRDRVILPFKEQFPDAPSYYQTALHELGHWTGHPHRLNRETLTRGLEEGFASPHYAREELRAEISSMITGDRLDLGHDPSRHAAYVGSWIQALRDDPREIYRASRDAQEMSDYLLDRGRTRLQARQEVIKSGVGYRSEREPRPDGARLDGPVAGDVRAKLDRRVAVIPLSGRPPNRERRAGPDR